MAFRRKALAEVIAEMEPVVPEPEAKAQDSDEFTPERIFQLFLLIEELVTGHGGHSESDRRDHSAAMVVFLLNQLRKRGFHVERVNLVPDGFYLDPFATDPDARIKPV